MIRNLFRSMLISLLGRLIGKMGISRARASWGIIWRNLRLRIRCIGMPSKIRGIWPKPSSRRRNCIIVSSPGMSRSLVNRLLKPPRFLVLRPIKCSRQLIPNSWHIFMALLKLWKWSKSCPLSTAKNNMNVSTFLSNLLVWIYTKLRTNTKSELRKNKSKFKLLI